MPTFSHDIPDQTHGYSLPIKRTPAYTKLKAIVTSTDLLGCYTHYWHGRTQPCEAPNCEPCENGMPYRWHAYLAAMETQNALHFIFEVTATGAEPFITYRDAHGTLRGCLFQAERWRQKANGRILIQTKPADLTEIQLPDAPNMVTCLATLWSLPMGNNKTTKRSPEKRTAIAPTQPPGQRDHLEPVLTGRLPAPKNVNSPPETKTLNPTEKQ